MKLTDKEDMSRWAYCQCKHENDTQEMRDLITDSVWAFYYCMNIKDIKEMWIKIKNESWALDYCKYVKDRPEVRKHIISKRYLTELEEFEKRKR